MDSWPPESVRNPWSVRLVRDWSCYWAVALRIGDKQLGRAKANVGDAHRKCVASTGWAAEKVRREGHDKSFLGEKIERRLRTVAGGAGSNRTARHRNRGAVTHRGLDGDDLGLNLDEVPDLRPMLAWLRSTRYRWQRGQRFA